MKLEICANSFQSAKNAEESGAHRIELCSELSLGGITPSYGLIKHVIENVSIETYVLIRPRSGNFTYSDSEFEIMKTNIQLCKDLGCSGIVSGILNQDNTIDIERTKALVELAKPLAFTFHRAFDNVPKPMEALEQLINLGVDRVLTSGQKEKAEEGFKLLKLLHQQANQRIIILPGSGINLGNVLLFKAAGFNEIHASAAKTISNKNNSDYFEEHQQTVSDKDTIKAILKALKNEV